jgi:3-hydroxymyristoyl/3-hydroxydecanoyl-(acyl carrier protein) dehydratase
METFTYFFNPNALPKSKSHNVLTHLEATWLLTQTLTFFAKEITKKIRLLTQLTKVQNIRFLSPLVPSKQENLVLLSLYIF